MKVSLVIAVKDEEGSVGRLLESISRQTRLPDEVLFIDADSGDKTRDIIGKYRDGRFELKLISIESAYPGTARNVGVENARHDFIAFTDGGIELHDDWLKELSRNIEKDSSVDVVYGHYAPRANTFFKQCLSLAFVAPQKTLDGKRMRTDFIASSLLKKHVWRSVGGFPDYRAAEDRIFMEKVREKGFKIRYNPRAVVVWDIPDNLKAAFMRFFDYSYHDLKAGRMCDWHLPVLKMYLVAAIFVLLGCTVSPVFLVLILSAFIFRVIRKMSTNRDEPYFRARYIPLYFIVTSFLIFLIDMAMFAGWIKYAARER